MKIKDGLHIDNKGTKTWYLNGEIHREDGPAIETVNGDKYWYKNGMIHREDGPAAEFADGQKKWLKNGQFHREDGPAIEYAPGIEQWFINGEELSETQIANLKVKIELQKDLLVNEVKVNKPKI